MTIDVSNKQKELAINVSISKKCLKTVDANGYKVMSVRMRAAEFECFSQQARALGLTNNMALRIAARRIAGFIEIDEQTRHVLQNLTDNIGELSIALSHLNHTIVNDGKIDMKLFTEQRVAFGRDFALLDGLLRTILNVSQRRQDGRLLLEKEICS